MEIDPDATPPGPSAPDDQEEPPPLPPSSADDWGVGGKEEKEGKFAPPSKKKDVDSDAAAGPRSLGPPGAVGVDVVAGFGAMRDVTNDSGKTGITVISFVLGARYRIGDAFTLGARFPASTASIRGPQEGKRDDYNTYAIGNVELSGRYAFDLTRRLRLPIEAAIDFPSASGDLFAAASDQGARAQALVNQAAAYSRGWEENPLFEPKRLGLRIGAGVSYEKSALHIDAGTRMDIMVKTGGNPPTTDTGGVDVDVRTPTLTSVTGASVFYDFFDGKLSPGLRAWLAVATLPFYTKTKDYGGPQLVLEPEVASRILLDAEAAVAIKGVLGVIVPVSGQLGGRNLGGQDAGTANGVRLRVELQF
jgi:hypothetical protein